MQTSGLQSGHTLQPNRETAYYNSLGPPRPQAQVSAIPIVTAILSP